MTEYQLEKEMDAAIAKDDLIDPVPFTPKVAPCDPPRWKNGPPICKKANLPAFETEKALKDFMARDCPRCKLHKIWLCKHCGGFHHAASPPDPTGDSSGTGRSVKGMVLATDDPEE